MGKIFKKMLFRNIITNFKQFLSLVIMMLLSMTLFTGFVTNYYSLKESLNNYYETTKLADLWVTCDKISENDENFLQENNLIYSKRLCIETTLRIKEKNVENNAKIYVYDGQIYNGTMHNGTLSIPYVNSGSKICYIDEKVAKNNNINVGWDELEFSFELKANSETYTVNCDFILDGIMNFDENASVDSCWSIFIAKESFLSYVKQSILQQTNSSVNVENLPYNQILIETDNVNEVKILLETYYKTTNTKLISICDRTQIDSIQLLNSEIIQAEKMIFIFPVIFLIITILIILSTTKQLIFKDKKKIGILKSIGVHDKKILLYYSGYGTILSLFGAILGSFLGPILIPDIMLIKYNAIYSLPSDFFNLVIPFPIILLLITLIFILGFCVSYIACLNFLHKMPVECLYQEINLKSKTKYHKKTNKKNVKSLFFTVSLRNALYNPMKKIISIVSVMGCVALLICSYGILDSLNSSINNDFDNIFKFDISSTYTSSNFESEIVTIDGIKELEYYQKYNVKITNCDKSLDTTMFKFNSNSNFFTFSLGDDDLLLSKNLSTQLGLSVGDKITIKCGDVSVDKYITEILETTIYNGIYTSDDYSFNNLQKINCIFINCSDSANIENVIDNVNQINGTYSAKSNITIKNLLSKKYSSLETLSNTLKIFSIFLIVIALFNFLFMLIEERNKQVALLKVIGIEYKNIWLALIIELVVVILIGFLLGLLLSYPLLALILKINYVGIINYKFKINFISILISLSIVLIVIVIMAILSLYKIKKVDMIDTLKNNE